MNVRTYHLRETYPFLQHADCDPTLTVYLQQNSKEIFNGETRRPCVLIIPGGAYYAVSEREGEPIALHFLPEGWQAAILHYSVSSETKGVWPQQLLEAAAAMNWISMHAESWHVDPERLAVCGFSAGGHLAAAYADYWNRPIVQNVVAAPRPKACILGYAVLTAGMLTHLDTIKNLTGGKKLSDTEVQALSMEKQVNADTPPTFLFHTANDTCVPVANSLCYANALANVGIPFEMHIYPDGIHGIATADEQTGITEKQAAADWLRACKAWLRRTV